MHNNVPHDELVKKLQPPKDAKTSVMLNSIGNGTMLGAMPFIIAESYYRITQKVMPPAVAWANLALTAVGAAWGYVSGKKEYARLQEYRQTITDQLIKVTEDAEEIRPIVLGEHNKSSVPSKYAPAPKVNAGEALEHTLIESNKTQASI